MRAMHRAAVPGLLVNAWRVRARRGNAVMSYTPCHACSRAGELRCSCGALVCHVHAWLSTSKGTGGMQDVTTVYCLACRKIRVTA